jgi:hypothetical protein
MTKYIQEHRVELGPNIKPLLPTQLPAKKPIHQKQKAAQYRITASGEDCLN